MNSYYDAQYSCVAAASLLSRDCSARVLYRSFAIVQIFTSGLLTNLYVFRISLLATCNVRICMCVCVCTYCGQ